ATAPVVETAPAATAPVVETAPAATAPVAETTPAATEHTPALESVAEAVAEALSVNDAHASLAPETASTIAAPVTEALPEATPAPVAVATSRKKGLVSSGAVTAAMASPKSIESELKPIEVAAPTHAAQGNSFANNRYASMVNSNMTRPTE
ncbi:MAG: ribonuclease E, partial [Ferrimonas sp.]